MKQDVKLKQSIPSPYYPYGSERLNEGSYEDTYTFTGKEQDDTGQYYFEARYYNPDFARFTQQDPVARDNPEQVYEDPQQLNTYSYVRNSPTIAIDPDGQLTVMIPGTWYDTGTWTQQDAQFADNVATAFGDSNAVVINESTIWSGGNRSQDRTTAAETLAEMINGINIPEGETLNLVGHSHGGNIAIELSKLLNVSVDNLVTLGTPVRDDYQPGENVLNHINIYSENDGVQTKGGGIPVYGRVGGLVSKYVGNESYWEGFFKGNEVGLAGRRFEGAHNIDVTDSLRDDRVHTQIRRDSSVVDKVRSYAR